MNFKLIVLPVLVILNLKSAVCAPGMVSFIVTSTENPKEGEKAQDNEENNLVPEIYKMDISSNVTNRYAKTLITSRVKNPAEISREATFSVILPEKAFITEFIMEIGGNRYQAYVKEKEEAKKIYDQAVSHGQSAAHVALSSRDSNKFTVAVNIEALAKAIFFLTYEELLERKNDKYELVLNIHPGQIVKELNLQVYINETRPLVFVKSPSLRTGNNEINKNQDKLDPSPTIEVINSSSALIQFKPDKTAQKEFAIELGGKESEGLSGQFVVQYDVERDPHGGEVLLQDGYFVHFFAPKDTEVLPKNVYFILDTSSSMFGVKLSQLKDAMTSILDEIKPEDTLSIVEFNSETFVWNIAAESSVKIEFNNYTAPFEQLSKLQMPAPAPATKENIDKAKKLISNMKATGGTYMIGGLEVGLYLVKSEIERAKGTDNHRHPLVIFLTDGEPNIGLRTADQITDVVTRLNNDTIKAPLFTLSFGDGADKSFLRKLSLKNTAFSRPIYDAADAALQLQEFYRQISSPLLSNVHFKYDSEAKEVTETAYPILFRGGEIVVAGCYDGADFEPSVNAIGRRGPMILRPKVQKPVISLERLWAYLTVRQILTKREAAADKTELTKKALKLALKYSFVTDVTSLVVVKPNVTEISPRWRRPVVYHHNSYSSQSVSSGLLPGANRVQSEAALSPSWDSDGIRSESVNSRPTHFSSGQTEISSGYVVNKMLIVRTTPAPILETVETPKKSSLDTSLKWLSAALNTNGTLTLPTGIFKLGDESLTIASSDVCAKTPKGDEGVCSLIKDCAEVFPHLTDFEVYKQFSCVLQNEYAGVCCPKKIVPV